MAFDRAKYLENLQRKYGVEGSVLNDSAYKNSIVETNQEQYKQGNIIETVGGTITEASYNVGKGFFGTFEGIVDFGASLIGNIGGLFNQDFKKSVEEFISTDYTSILIDDYLKYIDVGQYASRFLSSGDFDISNYDLRDYSAVQYLPEQGQNIVTNIEQAIGQVGATVLTGSLGKAGSASSKILANASLFTSASGRGTQEALQEGEELGKATIYGLLSGTVELATEKLVGGSLSRFTGSGLLDKPINNVINKLVSGNGAKSTILKHIFKVGIDSIGEGLEEVTAGMINPLLRRITNMQNQTSYTPTEAFEDFLAGALTSAITMGITETQNYKRAGGTNQYASQIVANDINDINDKALNDVEKYIDRAKQLDVEVDEKQINKIIEEANKKTAPLFEKLNRFQLNIQNFADTSVEQTETSEEVTETPVEQTEASVVDHKTTNEYKSLDTHQKWLTTRYFNAEKNSDTEIKYFNQLPENIRDKFRDLKYGIKKETSFVQVAPYYETHVTKDNYEVIKEKSEKQFIDNAYKIADSIGIKIKSIDNNIGGFEYAEGKNAGKKVKEISNTFEIESSTIEEADLFACLMGDLAYEQQEAVISANYLPDDSQNANAIELNVKYKNLSFDEVSNILLKNGIIDYTIDLSNQSIKILNFDLNNLDVSILENLATELGENYEGYKTNKISSRYLDRKSRKAIYEKRLEQKIGNTNSNRQLRLYTEKAYQKIELYFNEQKNNIETKLYKDSQSLREKTKYNKTDVENVVKSVNNFINFYLGEDLVNISSERKVDKLYNKIKRVSLNNEIDESNVDIFTEIFTEDILINIKIDEWSLDEWLSDEEYENVVTSLKAGFKNLFLNKGDQSSLVTDLKDKIDYLKDKIKDQKSRYADLKDKARALIQLERLEAQTKKKADWRDKNNVVGANIAPFFSDAYKVILSGGKLVSSTRLKVPELEKNVRERIKQYRDTFYNRENFADKDLFYNEEIGELIDNIADGNVGTDLSTQEILDLRKIIRNFNRIVSDYNKVRVEGRMIELRELGNKQNANIDAYLGDKETKWGKGSKYFTRTLFRRMNRFFSTPYYVFQSFDLGNTNGALSKVLVDKINNGEIAKDTMMREVLEYKNKNIDEKYIKNLKNEVEIEIQGQKIKIDKGTLLSLYTGLQREWAMKHYEQTEIIEFEDLNGVRHQIKGFDPNILNTLVEQKAITEEDIEVSKHLIQLYKIMAKYKEFTDTQILGYSNIEEGVYYPIHTRSSARPQNVDSSMQSMMKNLIRGFGFNKKTVSAKGSLFFENCFETLSNYMVNMGRYVAYADAITSTNRYLNTNITGDTNNPRYMKDVYLEKVDDKFLSYLTDYFQDIQGLKQGKQDLKWISTIRSNFSKAVLYANPKVVFQQLSAIPSFLTHTSFRSLGKAVGQVLLNPAKAIRNMKNNSASAYVRYDGTQLVDSIVNSTDTSKRRAFMRAFDNIGGAGISLMDRFALAIGYQACINEANGDIEKGRKLFEEAVKTSQPNTSISGASQARRGGELSKTFSMFTSQTQQNSTMILSALQELQYAQRMLKVSKEGKIELEHDTNYYEELVNKAKRKMKKYTTGFIAQATMVTLIAMAINYAMGKDDEEEALYNVFGRGMLENTLGSWNPIVNFVVNQVVNQGKYDFQLNTVTAINEALDAMNDSINLFSNLIQQKEIKASDIVGIFRGVSKISGIPLDNILKYGNWIVSWFTPATAVRLNNALYGVSASSSTTKLNSYISKGQENLAKQQLKDMMATYKTGATSDKVNDELYRLYSNGYNVLPSSVMSSIEINGEIYDMTLNKNKSRFMSVYSNATKAIEYLYESSYYRYLSDEAKAKAIKRVYDAYYSMAKFELSNGKYIIEGKFNALVASLGDSKANSELISTLSVYMAKINEIEADGKQTKKEKVVKFINSLKISKQMKYLLFVTAGYKISEKEESTLKSYLKQKNVDENTINVLIN